MQRPFDGDRRAIQQRAYGRHGSQHDGRRSLLGAIFAVSLFLLVAAVSARQATSPGPAQRLIESGVVATTDIDRLLAENLDPLRELAQDGNSQVLPLPGYPLDVYLTRDEVVDLSEPAIRALILSRSSALVYTQGLDAFDRTGRQSISRFSSQGLLELSVGQLSEDAHTRASLATTVLAIVVAVSGAAVVVSNTGWARLRALGVTTLLGAFPGLALAGLLWFVAGRIGGGDPFMADLRAISRSLLEVPLRNYLIVTILGAVITASGVIFAVIDRGPAAANAGADDPLVDDYGDFDA